ncbi:MAG: 2-dehydropantoate 2-reductase [Psychromonas sp.]|nr:2-dehydropantoate 2-reductase [Alteromonadales bacterium]MCP5079638.1 2-dehydropantoate 2-reductase [Psychromonas sp.]
MWQILGAGAIGCLWAANLLQSSQQVHLVSRKKLNQKQLSYQNIEGIKVDLDCPHSQQLLKTDSVILVCVKAAQVKDALLQQINNISPQQVIILMHNGMGCAEQLTKILPHNPIICATTANASLMTSPLNIKQTGLGITYLGAFNEQAKPFSYLAKTLNCALANTHWCEDIEQKLWLKLLINITINPLTAINQVNNGRLSEVEFQLQIMQMLDEMIPVLKSQQLLFEKSELLTIINSVIEATATNFSSMNRDIHFKRPTENDYINGYLLKKALQYNIETPLISSIYNQIKALENHSLAQ